MIYTNDLKALLENINSLSDEAVGAGFLVDTEGNSIAFERGVKGDRTSEFAVSEIELAGK